jgi:hypothetical protein
LLASINVNAMGYASKAFVVVLHHAG